MKNKLNNMIKILFVCTGNSDRSPTAEHIYKDYPGIETKSAGIVDSAHTPLSEELVLWADVIFCMESYHKKYIQRVYAEVATNKKIEFLNIPDFYEYMDPELVALIKERVEYWLPGCE